MGQGTANKIVTLNQQLSDVSQQLEAALEELHRIKSKCEMMFDFTVDGIVIYEGINNGKDFIIKDFNPAAEKIEKIDKKDVLNKNVIDVFPGIVKMGLHDVLRRVYLTGKEESFPLVQYKDNRIDGWRENRVFKLPTGELVVVYKDMTEFILSQRSLQDLEKAVDCCLEGVTIIDPKQPDNPVIYLNEGFEKISGYCKSDVLGRNLRFLLGPATDPDTVDKLRNAIEHGQSITVEILTYRKDGSEFWNRVAITPVKDHENKVANFIAVYTDISEAKKTEDILRKKNARLHMMATKVERANARLLAFREIATLKNADIKTLYDYTLKQVVNISNSKFGLLGLMDDTETEMIIHAWSGKVMDACNVAGDPTHFPIRDAGIWAEALRKREPVIINDYALPHEGKKGLPEGHVMFENMMCVPIFYNEKIVAFAACADKQNGYTKENIEDVVAFCDSVWTVIQKKYSEEEIQKKHQQLRTLTSRLSSAEEQERKKIAEGIHDKIIQPLIFLDVKMKSLDKVADKVELAQGFGEMRKVTRELIELSRSITFDLSDPVFYELGLEQAIKGYLSTEINEKYKIKTNFKYTIKEQNLDQDRSIFLYKSVKELLVNVLKHAKANTINISIEQKKNEIVTCVEDDGCGFGASIEPKGNGIASNFGLFNIREKADYLGGNLTIDPDPDFGSRVTITIPALKKGDK